MFTIGEEKAKHNENRIILMGKMRARNSLKMDCVDVFEKAEKKFVKGWKASNNNKKGENPYTVHAVKS